MLYIGDLSIQDVNVLCQLSRDATAIVEFGVGASTQVFAQNGHVNTRIWSIDTDPMWIDRVRAIINVMTIEAHIEFLYYEHWHDTGRIIPAAIDLAFNDGVDHLRADFAARIWPRLRVGGRLVFHDTRRAGDFSTVARFSEKHYLEIDKIEVNTCSSNLTVITKKIAEPYVNWNISEGRTVLTAGQGALHDTLSYVRDHLP